MQVMKRKLLPWICDGLETEALIEGKPVVVPKHEETIEFYGLIEEAEAHLGSARALLREKGFDDLAERVELLQRAVLLSGGVFAGYIDYKNVLDLIEKASEKLDEPPGWSITGCSVEEAEVSIAITKLRRAERLISRMSNKLMISKPTAEALSKILSGISYVAYVLRHEICRRGGHNNSVKRSLTELAIGYNKAKT